MAQKQCIWCGKLGERASERELGAAWAQPHADGTPCVCRHVTCLTSKSAKERGGRFFDGRLHKWVCYGCQPAALLRDAAEAVSGS